MLPVYQLGALKLHVSASHDVLHTAQLHPRDDFRHSRLDSRGQPPIAGTDPRDEGRIQTGLP